MLKLFLTPQAILDLEDIYEYTQHYWSLNQADIYQDLLFETMNTILFSPEIGTDYSFMKMKYQKLLSGKHIIFYRIEDIKCIIITKVIHNNQFKVGEGLAKGG